MKPQFSKDHPSYQNHRRQFWAQIFLPMIVTVLLIIAIAVITSMATFGPNGRSPVWAAISTIWLVIPVMIFGLIFLIILAGLIYLLARTLDVIPPYSSQAQYYVDRASSEAKRFSDMAAKPVFFIGDIVARIQAFFGRN